MFCVKISCCFSLLYNVTRPSPAPALPYRIPRLGLQPDNTTGGGNSDVTTAQSDVTTAQIDVTTAQSDVTAGKTDVSAARSDVTVTAAGKCDVAATARSDVTTASTSPLAVRSTYEKRRCPGRPKIPRRLREIQQHLMFEKILRTGYSVHNRGKCFEFKFSSWIPVGYSL
jgi:hypothetical protein